MHKSLFYQLPICNLFTQHVIYLLWRDTSSELWTPVLFSLLIKQPHQLYLLSAITILYFTANISFHTIRLILCIQQTGEIDNLTESLGQSILVVLCAGSTLLLTPVVRPTTSQLATPSEATPFSYWSIKPWFHTEGNLLLYSSYLPLGVPSGPLLSEYINNPIKHKIHHTGIAESKQDCLWVFDQ